MIPNLSALKVIEKIIEMIYKNMVYTVKYYYKAY